MTCKVKRILPGALAKCELSFWAHEKGARLSNTDMQGQGSAPIEAPSKSTSRKPWYKRWWVWAIAAVVVISGIGNALGGGDGADTPDDVAVSSQETPNPTQPEETPEAAASTVFQERFDKVCDAVTAKYQSIGSVSCQDADTWQASHDLNPQVFPHEYRDINVDFAGQIAYEVKVIADPAAALEHFQGEYTCTNIFGGSGSCIVGEASPDMMFSVIFYEQQDDAEANSIADGLRQVLESIS